jgi:hypothetical protein
MDLALLVTGTHLAVQGCARGSVAEELLAKTVEQELYREGEEVLAE